MAAGWTLAVHTIDVGQGDSSLIVARLDGVVQKAILVDAGLQSYSRLVHDYIRGIGVTRVDAVVVSHYDVDHAGGIIGLLSAQVVRDLAHRMAAAIGWARGAMAPGLAPWVRETVYATAAWLAMYNSTNLLAGLQPGIVPGPPLAQAATPENNALQVTRHVRQVKSLVSHPGMSDAVRTAVRVVAMQNEQTLVQGLMLAVRNTVTGLLYPQNGDNASFDTMGMFADCALIDIDQDPSDAAYTLVTRSGTAVRKNLDTVTRPAGAFRRVDPGVGTEIMWGASNPPGQPPNAFAPRVYVVAANDEAWPGMQMPGAKTANNMGIALLVRFNHFSFWTSGDFDSGCEDLLAGNLTSNPPPQPAPFVPLGAVAAFKVSHHGARSSTQGQQFLPDITPSAAVISCGCDLGLGHPTQEVVSLLYSTHIKAYLTNCGYWRTHVPGSFRHNQLGNAATGIYVAGDSNHRNLTPNRVRGDIILTVTQAAATAQPGPDRVMTIGFKDTTNAAGTRLALQAVRF